MNFKINIFGNNLEFSEEQMLGFKIQAFMNDLNEMLCVRIQNMFNTAGCLTNLSVNLEKNIKVIYQIMYEKTYEYIRGLNLLSNVEISDITMTKLDDTDRELWEEYKEFNHQMYQIKLEAEMDMRMQGVPDDKKQQLRPKYEREQYDEMEKRYEYRLHQDIEGLITKLCVYFITKGIHVEMPSWEAESSASATFEHLKSFRGSKEEVYAYAYQIFKINPTMHQYYEYCMLRFPEQLDRLFMLYRAVEFGIVPEFADKMIKNLFEKMPHDTEEETLVIKNILDNVQKVIDIHENKIVKKVEKLITDFDEQARTYRGILFSTREIRKQAEQDYEILREKYPNIQVMQEEECKNAKEWIKEQNYVPEIAKIFLEEADKKIKSIWASEDSEKFKIVFQNTDILKAESIDQAVQVIRVLGRTEDKERYIAALQGMNEENFVKFENSEKWENLPAIKKCLINGAVLFIGILLMPYSDAAWVISVAGFIILFYRTRRIKKEKKIWNLLTVDGTILHHQLRERIENDHNDPIEEKNV